MKNNIFSQTYKILWLAIIVYTAIIFGLLVFKYFSYGYNAIDLGIYSQVFYSSSQGQLFGFSIHPHLYLGDHFELFILLLLPFYLLMRSPLALLFFQTAIVALSAWPLYLIAKEKLSGNWPIFIALAYLLNPIILNLLFFEFHILPFAIFFLLFSFYFYNRNNFFPFLIFLFLSLTIREDVSFVAVMFGLLALLERKKVKWILTPILIGGSWFIAAYQLTSYFSQYGNYKFLSIYGWLGSSLGEIIKNFITRPWLIIKQLFNFNNIFLSLGLLLPLLGLPLLRLRYLIPALLIIIQLFLLKVSSTIILQTHYAALIIPFLYISAVFSLNKILDRNLSPASIKSLILKQKTLFYIVIVSAVIYSLVTFSPLLPSLNSIVQNHNKKDFTRVKQEISQLVNISDSVLSSYEFLPMMANRENLYSMHYAFLGKKQFSDKTYQVPVTIDKLLVDFNDFIIYYIQSQNMSIYQTQYATGPARIKQLIKKDSLGLKKIIDTMAIYEKDYQPDIILVEEDKVPSPASNIINLDLNQELILIAWEKINDYKNNDYQIIPISFYWQASQPITDDYQLELILKNSNNNTVYQKNYPLGYGLYPTSQWPTGKNIKINYWFLIPQKYNLKDYQLLFQVVSLKGYMDLNGVRTAEIEIMEKNNIGPSWPINYNTL